MVNNKLSIVIPSREEIFLSKTIDDLFNKASGEIEIIAVLDGYWPDPPLVDRDNLIILHRGKPHGMRAAINAGAAVASGKYFMKCDAHCMFAKGFDETLKDNMEDNWVVIPSRYSLDAENWAIEQNGKPRRDYHYLCFPYREQDPNKKSDHGLHGIEWWERGRERSDPKYDIDDTMSWQGSMWFMTMNHFHNRLHGLSEVGYGTFSQEPQEIGLKTQLGGGRLMVNKKTWYAHLHKGSRYGRMYHLNKEERQAIVDAHNYSSDYWMNNKWEGRIYDMEWLVEKFWPIPTWPSNWRDIHE